MPYNFRTWTKTRGFERLESQDAEEEAGLRCSRVSLEQGGGRGGFIALIDLRVERGKAGLSEELLIWGLAAFPRASRAGPRISSSGQGSNGSQNQGHMAHSTHTHLHQGSGS